MLTVILRGPRNGDIANERQGGVKSAHTHAHQAHTTPHKKQNNKKGEFVVLNGTKTQAAV